MRTLHEICEDLDNIVDELEDHKVSPHIVELADSLYDEVDRIKDDGEEKEDDEMDDEDEKDMPEKESEMDKENKEDDLDDIANEAMKDEKHKPMAVIKIRIKGKPKE